MSRAVSVLDAVAQLTVTFLWVHFTGDKSVITIAMLAFSAIKVIKAILGLLIRAIIQKRKGKTLRQAVKKAILVRSLSGANLLKVKSKSPARVHPQQSVEKKLSGDDSMT